MPTPRSTALVPASLRDCDRVIAHADLIDAGVTENALRAQLAAERWRRFGRAIVLHNGPLTTRQQRRVALINCGPRAVLTSFTSAAEHGLQRWERREVHVLAPPGTRRPPIPGLVLHRVGDWDEVDALGSRRLHALAPSLVLAASSFVAPDPACALLAAAVQQRLTRPDDLRAAVLAAPRTRHRRALLLAVGDVEGGAQALSEIRLGRLCRRFGLPAPRRQAIRRDAKGRKRYLDAEWDLPDGGALAVEIDGGQHMQTEQKDDDDVRQNAVVIGGTCVLRFSANLVRNRPELVAAQLRAALRPRIL